MKKKKKKKLKRDKPVHQCGIHGVDVFASDTGTGDGTNYSSPCSMVVAFGITAFISKLYPASYNHIHFMGDPGDEHVIVPGGEEIDSKGVTEEEGTGA